MSKKIYKNPEERNKKISDTLKLKWRDPSFRKRMLPIIIKNRTKNGASYVWTKEEHLKHRQRMKEFYRKRKEETGQAFSQTHIESIRRSHSTPEYIEKYTMPFTRAGLNVTESSIEKKVHKFLNKLRIKYIKHPLIDKYFPDILIPAYNLIIECDGDYWHNLPGIQEKDKMKDELYKSKSYKCLRLTEYNIKNNFQDCINKIQKHIYESKRL